MNSTNSISRRALTGSIFGAVAGAAAVQTFGAKENVTAIHSSSLNVKDFGAKGDEQTDDTQAFQAALNAAHQAGGGIVFVPASSYRLEGTLIIPRNVTLQGIFTAPPTTPWTSQQGGSVLLAVAGKGEAAGTPFIQLDYNATVKGLRRLLSGTNRYRSADPVSVDYQFVTQWGGQCLHRGCSVSESLPGSRLRRASHRSSFCSQSLCAGSLQRALH